MQMEATRRKQRLRKKIGREVSAYRVLLRVVSIPSDPYSELFFVCLNGGCPLEWDKNQVCPPSACSQTTGSSQLHERIVQLQCRFWPSSPEARFSANSAIIIISTKQLNRKSGPKRNRHDLLLTELEVKLTSVRSFPLLRSNAEILPDGQPLSGGGESEQQASGGQHRRLFVLNREDIART